MTGAPSRDSITMYPCEAMLEIKFDKPPVYCTARGTFQVNAEDIFHSRGGQELILEASRMSPRPQALGEGQVPHMLPTRTCARTQGIGSAVVACPRPDSYRMDKQDSTDVRGAASTPGMETGSISAALCEEQEALRRLSDKEPGGAREVARGQVGKECHADTAGRQWCRVCGNTDL